MTNPTIAIAIKELKILFRDKLTVLLMIIPLTIFPLISLGTGYIFNDSQIVINKSNVAVKNPKNIEQINQFFTENNNYYNVVETSEPLVSLSNGDVDFIVQAESDNTVSFVYNSKKYTSLFKATSCGEKFESQIKSEQKAKYPNMLICDLQNEKGEATNSSSIISLINPIILILILVQGSSTLANDMFAGEKERKTLELLFSSNIKKSQIYLGKVSAMLIVETISVLLCLLSYAFSDKIAQNNGVSFSLNYLLSLTLSTVSMCTICIFINTFVSLVSKSFRTSQIINEGISAIPVAGALYFLLRSGITNDKITIFIPIINTVKSMINTLFGDVNITQCIIVFAVNLFYCTVLIVISNKYMNSEKIFT
ncbi:MAG: ABC transporter permease subunit [Eubacterium sp.]